MGESLKPASLTREEKENYGNFSPDQVARIVDASLLYDPENFEAVSTFINEVQLNEQFIILLMKGIQPKNTAFFRAISGICDTRIKEIQERV